MHPLYWDFPPHQRSSYSIYVLFSVISSCILGFLFLFFYFLMPSIYIHSINFIVKHLIMTKNFTMFYVFLYIYIMLFLKDDLLNSMIINSFISSRTNCFLLFKQWGARKDFHWVSDMIRSIEKYLTALWRMDCSEVTLTMRFKRLWQKFT